MTNELAAHIKNLQQDLARILWLEIVTKANRFGRVNVIYRELMSLGKINLREVKKLLNFPHAQQKGVIEVLATTDSFTSLQFCNWHKTSTKPAALKPRIKKDKTAESTENTNEPRIISLPILKKKGGSGTHSLPPLKTASHTNEAVITTLTKANTVPAELLSEKDLLNPPLPVNYTPSPALHRMIVGDYCGFYKGMIVSRAALVGNHIEKPMNPKINPYDGKAFKELAIYFAANGFGIAGEHSVRLAFQRIYAQWHLLPNNYQDYFSPAQINRNISGIYAELTRLSEMNRNKTKNKKDAELTEKLNQSQPSDFSYMVRS